MLQIKSFLFVPQLIFSAHVKTSYSSVKNCADRLNVCCLCTEVLNLRRLVSDVRFLTEEVRSVVKKVLQRCYLSQFWVQGCRIYRVVVSLGLLYKAPDCMVDIMHRDTLSYHKAEVKSDCVSLNELSMSTAKASALSALVTLEKEESRGTEKQRKAFIIMSPNLLQLYVRVQARTGRGGGVGERIASAVAGCSMVAFFPFCGDVHTQSTDTHTHTTQPHQGIPPGSTQVE